MPSIAVAVLRLFGVDVSVLVGRVIEIGVLVAGVLAAWGVFAGHYERRGAGSALEQVETNDRKAGERADASVDDVDRCYDAGGVWVVSTRKCDFEKRP